MDTMIIPPHKRWILDIDTVVFSGGGIKGICHLGLWNSLCTILRDHKRDPDTQIRRVMGASAGAVFAFFVALRCHKDILESQTLDGEYAYIISDMHIASLSTTWGLNDKTRFRNTFKRIIQAQGGHVDMTFKQLLEFTGMSLHVSVSCINTAMVEIHSPEHTPDYPVIPSVLASMAIPFIFSPEKINGKFYCDGGILDNIPMPTDDPGLSKTVVFRFAQSLSTYEPSLKNVTEYLQAVVYLPVNAIENARLSQIDPKTKAHVIEVTDARKIASYDFNIPKSTKLDIIHRAAKTMLHWGYPQMRRLELARMALQMYSMITKKEDYTTSKEPT